MKKQSVIALYGATALTALLAPQAGWAQAAPAAPADATAAADDSVITVTARRREESIVDVPLAITVVSGATLDRLAIRSTADLANFTPGLQFSDFTPGNSRNDRGGNRPIIFRGLNLSRNGGVTGAGSMFLDGAAVIGNEIPGGYDIGAVEVLRGPQNVYFGRASMTGAVSYRTAPIPKTFGVQASITIAERQTQRFEASIAGPLIDDILGIRVTGLYETNDGFVTNAYNPSGPKFGARSRRSISATVNFNPTDTLEIKLYGNYFKDKDGVSATVNIFPDAQYSANTNGLVTRLGAVTNCLRGVAATVGGVTTNPRATICGEVPGLQNAFEYSRTDIPADHAATLFGVPFLQGEGFDRVPGMQRNVFNAHAVVNFQLSDYLKIQSITGYHTNAVIQVVDGAQQPPTATSIYSILFFGLTNKFTDFSQELRLSSDPERALSWTIGANYVNAKNLSNAVNTRTSNTQPTVAVPNPVQTYNPLLLNIGDDRAKTYGFFAGAYLKMMDNKLTISAEGRYQIDKRFNQQISFATGTVLPTPVSGSFRSFNPRVSIDYDVGGRRKIYASFSQGSRPGGFNNGLLSFFNASNPIYTPIGTVNYTQTVADINAAFGITNETYKEEKLSIGELGFKGYLPNGKGYFDLNAYYGRVTDQQVTQTQRINALNSSLSAVTNTGEVEIYGIEFSGSYDFTPQISLATTFAWNQTNRIAYLDPTPGTIALYGFSDFKGLELPNAPKFSGSAVLTYEQTATADWSPFGNVALVYRGKQWADIGNFAYIPARATVDLRIGSKNDRVRIEAFVTNVFDNKTYPGGNVASDFGINQVGGITSSPSGFFGAFADPRTFGGRISAKF